VHLFYQTYGNGRNDAICHAWSDDGLNFERDPTNPIFRPAGDWTCGRAIDADVIAFKNRLLLYWATRDPTMKTQMQGVAAAPLDSDFSREQWTQLNPDGPILAPQVLTAQDDPDLNLAWEKQCIEAAAMAEHDGRLYMFYAGGYNNDPQQIGVAVSDNGLQFRRLSGDPLVPNGPPGSWNHSESGHPYLFQDDDGRDYLFYQGNNTGGKTWYLSVVPIEWDEGQPVPAPAALPAFSSEAGEPANTVLVSIDPRTTYQTIDGFGASDAWRCQFVGKNWPLEKRERIADLLFSQEVNARGNPQGIGLSIWRFYLSAGTAEQGVDSDIGNPWRRGECFLNAEGSYDWSKLAGQQWFLQAARERGVERFLAFPNSPPVELTRNGKGYAPKGYPSLNLKPGRLDDYATYLVDVIEHFEKEGFHFDYLSPINEPQWAWDGSGQEGTPASNVEIYALIRYLSRELTDRELSTRLVIGEAGTIGHVLKKMDDDGRDDQAQFFFNPTSPFYVGDLPNVAQTISAHSYHSVWPLDKQVEYRHLLRESLAAANPDLGYWMSEYCILQRNGEIRSGGRRDLGMDTALYVARIIHHDLTIAQARSWQWWTAVSQVDFKDGLVYLDDGSEGDSGRMGSRTESLMHDGEIRESKLLWALGNYSRFVRPGMVRVRCEVEPNQSHENGLLASAYCGDDDEVVLVLVNLSSEAMTANLGSTETVDVYTTSADTNLARSQQDTSEIDVPARAVATVCLTMP